MELESVVVHEIEKNEHSTGAELFLTSSALDHLNEDVVEMIDTLDSSFGNKSIRRAKFAEDGFRANIPDFNSIDLIETSKALTEKLKDGIQNISAAKGGYLVFCKYETTRPFLSVFLVRNTKGSFLRRADDSSWDIESTIYLDVENFAMGARINLHVLLSDSEDRYIHLVKGNTDVADYFENWIGIEDKKQESKDGEALYNLANNIELPDAVEDRDEFKKQIYDYVNGRPSKVVNLRELSEYLYSEPNKISNFCEENELDIDGEFKLSGAQLNKFYKVYVRADGIKLEASREKFKATGISVSEDGTTVTIRSSEFAQAVQDRLSD